MWTFKHFFFSFTMKVINTDSGLFFWVVGPGVALFSLCSVCSSAYSKYNMIRKKISLVFYSSKLESFMQHIPLNILQGRRWRLLWFRNMCVVLAYYMRMWRYVNVKVNVNVKVCTWLWACCFDQRIMLSYFNQLWGKTKNIYTFLSAYKIVCLTLYCLNLYRTKS